MHEVHFEKKGKILYLDNNATTAIAPEVIEAMQPYLWEHFGNPSSAYAISRCVRRAIEDARGQIAGFLGADADEIVFTSCGTESDNAALNSALEEYSERRHVITTAVEHPAVLNFARRLQGKGYRVTFIPVDPLGRLDLEQLKAAIDTDTAVVSVMHANNETGVLFPIDEIGAFCRERGVLFHTDAVQSIGKVPINLKKLRVDMLSLSGHKLHAPKGIGVLYVRKGVSFTPYVIGGHQEDGHRAGTENVASIVGLGRACALASKQTAVAALRDRLERGLLERCAETRVNGDRERRLPNTTNISFGYIEGEAILMKLDAAGICASSGSACSSGADGPSHVLQAMAVPPEYIRGSIRFSLSSYTTADEIDQALAIIPLIITDLRQLSPWTLERGSSCWGKSTD
ncbi:MAG TPA: cysteine desulfurase NifS [Dissulfurispiraceae bacterium]|nr:cysteine desulfurase NifS [Dissulfurispiraceae bacterium]